MASLFVGILRDTTVLIRDRAPSEHRNDLGWNAARLFKRINWVPAHGAAVLQASAKVEDVFERSAEGQVDRRQRLDGLVEVTIVEAIAVCRDDSPPIRQHELVQMRDVPSGECAVDSDGDLGEGMASAHQEIPTRRLGQFFTRLPAENHAKDQPARQAPSLPDDLLARSAHRAFRPPFHHSQNSSREISRSRRRRLSACGHKPCDGWQCTATLLPERLVTLSCGDASPCRPVPKNFSRLTNSRYLSSGSDGSYAAPLDPDEFDAALGCPSRLLEEVGVPGEEGA